MQRSLASRRITLVEVTQEKCLNIPTGAAVELLRGRTIERVSRLGKWLCLHLQPEYFLLLNLGMGADLRHRAPGAALPAKYQLRIDLDEGSGLTCRFWWFGYIRLLSAAELATHPETAKLGPDPLQLTAEQFATLARSRPQRNVKSLILDQSRVSGIGNAYAHDILFTARLHPQRKLGSLSDEELIAFHEAIRYVMERAIKLGGIEQDFFGTGGNMNHWESFCIVGYREGKSCPRCGTAVVRIKTGSTATFLCPMCQPA